MTVKSILVERKFADYKKVPNKIVDNMNLTLKIMTFWDCFFRLKVVMKNSIDY